MSDHHVRWSSSQRWTSLCWSYLLYDSRSTFRSPCSEAISADARLVMFNLSIPRVQNWLVPIVCELRAYHTRSSCGVSARRILQRCILRENTFTLKFSERSSYNATAELCKNKMYKRKTSHAIQICGMIWLSSSVNLAFSRNALKFEGMVARAIDLQQHRHGKYY